MADDTDTIDRDTTDDKTADTGADKGADTNADDKGADKTDDAPDWRAQFSGGDEKLAGFLGKHASPKALAEAAKKLSDDAKNSNAIKPLGDDPSEADLKAYRTAMGVPETPADYGTKLSEGFTIGEDDKPVFDKFFEAMHEANAPPAIVAKVVDAYRGIVEEQDAAIAERTDKAKADYEETMREEWGKDFKRNQTATDSFIGTAPAEVQAALSEGFGPDGLPLATNPHVRRWLAALAFEANPLATVVPGAGDQVAAVADRIATIEKMMREDRAAYNKDEAIQQEYRNLLTAREKMK